MCVLACLAAQSCVTYLPPPENGAPAAEGPPPQPPAYPAQAQGTLPPPPPPPAYPPGPTPPTPNAALDALVAPIALYPDPLIALILPASTVPADISAASTYLAQYGDPSRIDSQPWDPSVRALAHYPTVISWLAQNMDWTQALGAAFGASPAAVMDSIQRLRARAAAAGTLVSNAEQRVVTADSEIEIVPADPTTLYVPEYDPDVVYSVEPYYGMGSPIVFGPPCSAGIWLSYSFDWRSHTVWAGQRQSGAWQEASAGRAPPGSHTWHPPASAAGGPVGPARPHENIAPPRPQPMPGAPKAPLFRYKNPSLGNAETVPMERPRLNGTPAPAAPEQPLRTNGPAPYAPERASPPGYSPPPAGVPAPAKPSEPSREREAPAPHAAPASAPAPAAAPTPEPKGH
jgi:hypothetical protein